MKKKKEKNPRELLEPGTSHKLGLSPQNRQTWALLQAVIYLFLW
jgi:hypothetical protein